ncbi:hypothetical protein [Burkholderia pyrrocinia]|nr:hypothetical protein [Burkholderia pyrrocinia]
MGARIAAFRFDTCGACLTTVLPDPPRCNHCQTATIDAAVQPAPHVSLI